MNAPVIIVGGGPVGLSLALGLARYGVASTIIERDAQPHAESRAAVIWPRTIEIFRDWNVFDALRTHARCERVFCVWNAATDKPAISAHFESIADVFDDPCFLMIPQSETERVLREAVQASPLCTLIAPATVTGLRQDSQFVDVFYSDASGEHTLRGTYAVGCDGARGIVRSLLGLTLEGITYDSRAVLSDERIAFPNAHDATARARFDMPGILVAFHLGDDLWRVIGSVAKETPDEDALSEPAARTRITELFGEVEHQTLWRSIFKIHRRHAQRFLIGRVALAGDSAHLNSPAGGQGMNAGIQDAANLAWKLAAALHAPQAAQELLDSYDIERREMVTDTVERYTNRLTRIGLGLSWRIRSFALRGANRATKGRGLQRKLSRSLGMLSGRYTQSPIVDARHPLAGRRVDDVALSDGTRINQRRNGDAALISVGGGACGLAAIELPEPLKRWHVKLPCALIVRPDGCVAAVVEHPTREKIEAAWQKAFCGALPLPAEVVA